MQAVAVLPQFCKALGKMSILYCLEATFRHKVYATEHDCSQMRHAASIKSPRWTNMLKLLHTTHHFKALKQTHLQVSSTVVRVYSDLLSADNYDLVCQ